MRANRIVRLGIVGMIVGAMFAAAPAAMAKGGVTTRGACSGAADWKLKVSPEDGGMLEVQFRVEDAKPGQEWTVQLADNGTQIFSGSRTANDLGKFKVRTMTADRAGSDTVTAQATNTVTGQTCNGSATL
ncbi:MAG TPA: hypothetical protein VGB19_00845 [Actinomycetota bacterium]|nr:hypothetical protein [Actinomycetota bacterium]